MQRKNARSGRVIESLETRTLLSAAVSNLADGLTSAQLSKLRAAGSAELHQKLISGATGSAANTISSNLLTLYEEDPTGRLAAGQFNSIETSDGSPAVSVHTHASASRLEHKLLGLGMKFISENGHAHLVDGYLPISSLVLASKVAGVISITAIAKPTVHSVGSAVNQADQVENVMSARGTYAVDGTGVKIGVISDSVGMTGNGLADSVASGDLPNTVHVLQDGQPGDTDEGRAMLEEIHDLAPGAALYFYSGDGSQDNMATAVNALRAAGCNIIVDDIGYLDEPMFQDGVISKAINTFVNGGGSYYSAIGNDGNSGYLRTNLQYTANGDGTTWVNWANNGAASGESLQFTTDGPVDITLQWANPYNGDTGTATSDLNVFIYNSTGTSLVESSTDNSLSTGIPEQALGTLNPGTYQMRVQLAGLAGSAQPASMLKFVAAEDANGGLTSVQYTGIRSSGYGHAVGANTISVGAVEFASAPPYSFAQPIHSETYSSTGPIIYGFDINGNPLPSPLTLDKPDISGVDGVNTSFFGEVTADDPTSLPQFYGTSAAAPNVAAVGALIDQFHPGATQTQILAALKASATPLNGAAAGAWDPQGGYGLVDATKALAYFGNPSVAPTVLLTAVLSPRTTPLASESIVFNEAVTGFTLSALTLSYNGGPNLLTGTQTLTSTDQIHFTLGNLAGLTGSSGSYTLTLNGSGSGIMGDGIALVGSQSASWQMTGTSGAPTVTFGPITSPTTGPIGSETINFNEAVSGFALSALTLTDNGGPNLLTSAQTLTTTDQIHFTLGNLGALTGATGTYVLTISGAGGNITGGGQPFAGTQNVSWQVTSASGGPTVSLALISTPRTTAVGSETITFNEPVSGFTMSSLSLSENLGPNLLTNAQTLTSSDQTTFILGNLTFLTSSSGSYDLSLDRTGISAQGQTLGSSAAISWYLSANVPVAPTIVLAPVATPTTNAISSEAITFSESVSGFSLSNLTLTRNGGANLLTSAQTVTSSNQTSFTLNNLSGLTSVAGTYVLTLSPTGISGSGGSLAAGRSVSWVVNATVVKPTVSLGAITTPRTTAVVSESVVFSRSVTGLSLANLTLTRNGGANLLTSAQTLTTSNQTIFTLNNLSAMTKVAGTYALTLKAGSISGGGQALASGASITWKTSATLAGEHLFYNDSAFDGFNAAGNSSDDKATATDKSALLPGKTAAFANISSYYFGLNGIMVDIAGLAASKLTTADFTFKTGNSNTTSSWATGPNPSSIVVRPGAGVGGSTRVELIWPNHSSSSSSAVANKWLQVTVKADSNTGLSANGIFYFGSAIGLTGLSKTSAAVTSADANAIKAHESTATVMITNDWDITRNGIVNSSDAADAQANETSGSRVLQLIAPH